MTVPVLVEAAATEVRPRAATLASPERRTAWRAAGLAAITFVVFARALSAQFLNWNDPGSFLQNEAYRGLGWQNLWWTATTFHMGTHQPVGWFCCGVEYVLFGMNAAGYHSAGVLFHVGPWSCCSSSCDVTLAKALRAAGHLDEARTALERALALDPGDRGALDELRTLQSSPATSPTGTR